MMLLRGASALVAMGLTLSACASGRPPAETPVVDIDRLDDVVGRENEPFIVRIPAGSRLPVTVEVSTPFVHSESGPAPIELVFDRTVYWYPRTPDQISFDGLVWQEISEGHNGHLTFGLGKSERLGSHASVRVALTPRGAE